MVADIRAGREPDPTPGIIGKQRSVHNTYFTLPVLFVMISNHYPMTYSHPYGWLVLGVIMLAGVLIRQFFVLRHKGRTLWALPAVAVALLAGLAVALAPAPPPAAAKAKRRRVRGGQGGAWTRDASRVTRRSRHRPDSPSRRRASCWRRPEQIGQNAAKIAETVGNRYMPIGNLTQMTDDGARSRRRVGRAGRQALSAAGPCRCHPPCRAAPRTSGRSAARSSISSATRSRSATPRIGTSPTAFSSFATATSKRSGRRPRCTPIAAGRRRRDRLPRQDHPAGIRRHARSLRPDRHHRVVRRAAPRVARKVHVSGRGRRSPTPGTRARWRNSSSPSCCATARRPRWCSRRRTGRRSTRSSPRRTRRRCASSPARC